ncbi:hypothetical protein [Psychromonas aquimarina]|uniref:hypothetical protein n=1 Tax=Psychromonas aquimarina TaxID=444919 RepID=UPI00048C9BB4|nr:hypothetical protein [Psychromonas aquimarina]
MKKILLLLLTVSASSFAADFKMDTAKFDCPDLEFELNLTTNTVTFSNIRYFGIAEMIADAPLGFTWSRKDTVKAEYNWFYTTEIKIRFLKKIYEMESGSYTDIFVEFDDNDGITNSYNSNKKMTCKVI